MTYEGMVYRPPSEARSFILQVTIGCARNECTFCTMYKAKQFRMRKMPEIMADIDEVSKESGSWIKRIFLADGDALVMPCNSLLEILKTLKEKFPNCERITSYGAPLDVLAKTNEELSALKDEGLDMVYIGLESGDDEVLRRVKKQATSEQIIEAVLKLKKAGIKSSVTLISGLGGKERRHEHAIESAKAVSMMKPDYLGFLTLMLEPGAPMLDDLKEKKMELLSADEVMDEMEEFLSNVDSEGTVFRANHASNYLSIGGNLNGDIPKMLEMVRRAKQSGSYKNEVFRAL